MDLGVRRSIKGGILSIELSKIHKKYFPFILLREACYSFIPSEPSKYVKICINQIIENILSRLPVYKVYFDNMTSEIRNLPGASYFSVLILILVCFQSFCSDFIPCQG